MATIQPKISVLSVLARTHFPRPRTHEQSFHGPVGNVAAVIGSRNVSIAQGYSQTDLAQIESLIDRINSLIQRSQELDPATKADYQIDAEQLKGELKRPKLDGNRIWSLIDKITKLKGATDIAADLWQHRSLLEHLLKRLGI